MLLRTSAAAAATLAVLITAFAVAPTSASDEVGELTVTVTITQTVPRVEGFALVVDANGDPVVAADLVIVNTHEVDGVPPATTTGITNTAGIANIAFQLASTALLPGAHVVTVTAEQGDASGEGSAGYAIP